MAPSGWNAYGNCCLPSQAQVLPLFYIAPWSDDHHVVARRPLSAALSLQRIMQDMDVAWLCESCTKSPSVIAWK